MKQNVLLLALANLVCAALTASAAIRYVNLNNPTPAAPYTNWPTAATNIQDAVDAADPDDEVVVTNGLYATGGRAIGTNMLVNRVAVDKPLTLRSATGPTNTIIQGCQAPGTTNGDGAVRCVYLTAGASLSGFTLTNGATRIVDDYWTFRESAGGGAWCESATLISNCVLVGNSAYHGGGGVFGGRLFDCNLTGNVAGGVGGGALGTLGIICTLNNCTLTGNRAQGGGGAAGSILNNCSVNGNWAFDVGGGAYGDGWMYPCTLNNCTLTGNSATEGGGAAGSRYWGYCLLNDCRLSGNFADNGGGAVYSGLNGCLLERNSAVTSAAGRDGDGGGARRCTLNNCLVVSNSASRGGGGVSESTLNNSTLSGNSANGGGGAVFGTLNNCIVTDNSASGAGGGTSSSSLNNCVVTGNSAAKSGGGLGGTTDVKNSVVYFNTATAGSNYEAAAFLRLDSCCTTPMPTNGVGNITNSPLFVDLPGGNLRLQSTSSCINAGNNAYAPGGTDLDGNPRIVSGTVDIGAYEFQDPGSTISYAWLQQFGLPTDGSADASDPDSDGLNNWQEWCCATDPTNALSVLRLLSPVPSGTNMVVSWQSVAGVNYAVERSTNLGAVPAFSLVQSNIPGQMSTTAWTDTNALGSPPRFYRVRVGN